MTLTYKITRRELFRFYMWVLLRSRGHWLFLLVLSAIFFGICLHTQDSMDVEGSGPVVQILAATFSAALGILFMIFYLRLNRVLRLFSAAGREATAGATVSLLPGGVTCEMPSQVLNLSWEHTVKLVESGLTFYPHIGRHAVIVPRRVFPSFAEYATFVDTAKQMRREWCESEGY